MKIDIITLFPNMFTGPLSESIIRRAIENQKVAIQLHQLRDFSQDKHKTVDDTPYGGGAGMVLKVDVLDRAIEQVKATANREPYTILLTPQGKRLDQSIIRSLAAKPWLILVCGHYEGFDERVRSLVDSEISIGDYVLTGGELPAMVLVDATVRLLPGVLGKERSHQEESFEANQLEYPQYTRPEEYRGMKVPEILKTGDHAAIALWRQEQAKLRTGQRRPDLGEIQES